MSQEDSRARENKRPRRGPSALVLGQSLGRGAGGEVAVSWQLRGHSVSGATRPLEHRGREAGRVKPGSAQGVPQGGRPAWGGTGVGRWRSAGLVEGGREEGVNFFLPASGVRRGR